MRQFNSEKSFTLHLLRGLKEKIRLVSSKKDAGFTLTELLIVISIIGILSLITFPYYRSARQQLAVQRASSRLAQDVRRAQEMAMSVERVDSDKCFTNGDPKHPDDYEYGFGIHLTTIGEEKQYHLYADCNGDERFKGPDEDFELYIVDLVNVESIYIQSTATTYNYFDIVFTPPDPYVSLGGRALHMNDPLVFEDEVSIVIRALGDPLKTKTVTVNKAGLVTIE